MDVTGAVAAAAAGLAAAFAGVNLYLTGRRELNKWTRETFVELFVAFLDASFKQGTASGVLLRSALSDAERIRLQAEVVAAHDVEIETLTRLRLLAPSNVVTAALTLLETERRVATACFLESSLPIPDDPESLFKPVFQARGQLIESARSAIRLPDTGGTGQFASSGSWREFRAVLQQAATSAPTASSSGGKSAGEAGAWGTE
jgi:hypothetical protein